MNQNISFIFPISDGGIGTLYLPTKITRSDALRLKRMINALYLNGQPKKTQTNE